VDGGAAFIEQRDRLLRQGISRAQALRAAHDAIGKDPAGDAKP
jgi:hypothetical protein